MKQNAAFLVSAKKAQEMDWEAFSKWGLHQFSLVEAAGRTCGENLAAEFHGIFSGRKIKIGVFAGTGNNGADALVMLRYMILRKYTDTENCCVLINKTSNTDDVSPRAEALQSLKKMGVVIYSWNGEELNHQNLQDSLEDFDFLVDGICGTGLNNELQGIPLEMVKLINAVSGPVKISIDVPSGLSDTAAADWHRVHADVTLAIEPLKTMLYVPSHRVSAGRIIPVEGIFPCELIKQYVDYFLWSWETVKQDIKPLPPDSYKYSRGLVSIYAGAAGTSGAAVIASRGAQASGAGLVRLYVDRDIYPVTAVHAGGIMAVALEQPDDPRRFQPDAVLLGPGWGRAAHRVPVLEKVLEQEEQGIPVVLDADGIFLSKNCTFHGNALITPHPGELSQFLDLSREKILENPIPILLETARSKNLHILFKSHVLFAAAPDGRISVIDGMLPVLGTGGSGDLLSGLCAGLAGRMKKEMARDFDFHYCSVLAACLLVEAGKQTAALRGFPDPLDMADTAARIAGEAWLGTGENI